MTDKIHHQAEKQDDDQTDKGQTVSQQNQEKVFYYSQKDVDNARQMVEAASKMLGKLDIDGKPGVSRDEILKAAGNKHLSEKDGRVLDALANIEPNVQTAWQVPGHRAHLKMSSEAEFERNAAKLLRKRDSDWADDLDKDAAKLEAQSKKDLQTDRRLQTDIYFGKNDINPAKLNELKEQINRVDVAMHVMKDPKGTAEQLIKKFDRQGDGLSLTDVQAALKNPSLSTTDRLLLTAASATEANGAHPTYKFVDLENSLKAWAQGETRSDKHNKEQLFFAAIEGYNGNGIGIKSRERFNLEMDVKDSSQLGAYDRANNDYRSIPHPRN